jgi:hypothetical protein
LVLNIGFSMRRFQQLSFLCLVTVSAISLTALSGCDLGTYSKRSTEYLQANPGGVKKKVTKEETSAVDTRGNHLRQSS